MTSPLIWGYTGLNEDPLQDLVDQGGQADPTIQADSWEVDIHPTRDHQMEVASPMVEEAAILALTAIILSPRQLSTPSRSSPIRRITTL